MTMQTNDEGLSYVPYNQIQPNPYNPRELFDRTELDTLKESIRQVGVLVPLLVYKRKKDDKIIILDGERRWRCVSELVKEYPEQKNKWENMPTNIIAEPDMVSNILRMFNIHNVRQPWELMPTALKLDILMKELNERDDEKISKLTGLSSSNVRRCKILLDYDKEFQDAMMHPDPEQRIKADFFIELYPVLNLIQKNLPNVSEKYSRLDLIRTFLTKYKNQEISNVLNFRDLADAIRSMKKGNMELKDCEQLFFDLLGTKSELKEFVIKTYHPTKRVEILQRTLESTIEEVISFEPSSVIERDRIQKILNELLKTVQNKIRDLEKFEDME